MRRLTNIGRLFTGTPAGVIEKASVIVDDERIAWCGREGEEPLDLLGYVSEDEDCGGGLVTAGLIDAHTHPVYAGNRMAEVAMRTAGASYSDVAKAGGGIRATVKATREASPAALEEAAGLRLKRWLEGGATTVEAKTGYHLEREGELESTRILARLGQRTDLPRIEVTFLAAHALPPDRGANLGKYAKEVARWCPDAHQAGARFCDVFCDQGYFSVDQSRHILKAALEAKLIPRIHADELARTGGSRLAAELHAVSADHLLCANRSDAVALARAGVVATLAPGTAISIGRLPPCQRAARGRRCNCARHRPQPGNERHHEHEPGGGHGRGRLQNVRGAGADRRDGGRRPVNFALGSGCNCAFDARRPRAVGGRSRGRFRLGLRSEAAPSVARRSANRVINVARKRQTRYKF